MKIVDERKGLLVAYNEIKQGQVFLWEDKFYLKTDYKDVGLFTASVCLENGAFYTFPPSHKYQIVDVELHVKG